MRRVLATILTGAIRCASACTTGGRRTGERGHVSLADTFPGGSELGGGHLAVPRDSANAERAAARHRLRHGRVYADLAGKVTVTPYRASYGSRVQTEAMRVN